MIIPVNDGRGLVAEIEIWYDTNGNFVARIAEVSEENDTWRRLRNRYAKAYGPTIQDAFNNLRDELGF